MNRTKTGKLKSDYAILKHKKGNLIKIIKISNLSSFDDYQTEKLLNDEDMKVLVICKNTTKNNAYYIKNEIVKSFIGKYPNGSEIVNGYKIENDK